MIQSDIFRMLYIYTGSFPKPMESLPAGCEKEALPILLLFLDPVHVFCHRMTICLASALDRYWKCQYNNWDNGNVTEEGGFRGFPTIPQTVLMTHTGYMDKCILLQYFQLVKHKKKNILTGKLCGCFPPPRLRRNGIFSHGKALRLFYGKGSDMRHIKCLNLASEVKGDWINESRLCDTISSNHSQHVSIWPPLLTLTSAQRITPRCIRLPTHRRAHPGTTRHTPWKWAEYRECPRLTKNMHIKNGHTHTHRQCYSFIWFME